MTAQDFYHNSLTERGMFESQADEVFDLFSKRMEEDSEGYDFRWDKPILEWPQPLQSAGSMILNQVARAWIEQNAPQAWFRPMFE